MIGQININVRRELFSFSSKQDWINRAHRLYRSCGVNKGFYITVDALGHVMHMGKCFSRAEDIGAFPVTVYELKTNWCSENDTAQDDD